MKEKRSEEQVECDLLLSDGTSEEDSSNRDPSGDGVDVLGLADPDASYTEYIRSNVYRRFTNHRSIVISLAAAASVLDVRLKLHHSDVPGCSSISFASARSPAAALIDEDDDELPDGPSAPPPRAAAIQDSSDDDEVVTRPSRKSRAIQIDEDSSDDEGLPEAP